MRDHKYHFISKTNLESFMKNFDFEINMIDEFINYYEEF